MYVLPFRCRRLILATACLTCARIVTASDEPTLTKEQIKQFLLTAKVVDSKESKKGVTNTWRLTLSDGTLTHDASFESIDKRRVTAEFSNGQAEVNFVDSYKYNIAAYALAELLGLDDMLPVYVERKWQGEAGSLSWWLPVKMDEMERVKKKIPVKDIDAWNRQMYRIQVFDELVYDTDPNLTNVLIGEDWKLWRIDFTRAFRISEELRNPKGLVRCDRQLFDKLRTLDANEVTSRTTYYLTKTEVRAVMARRDKIVTYFQKLVSEKGENEVLY